MLAALLRCHGVKQQLQATHHVLSPANHPRGLARCRERLHRGQGEHPTERFESLADIVRGDRGASCRVEPGATRIGALDDTLRRERPEHLRNSPVIGRKRDGHLEPVARTVDRQAEDITRQHDRLNELQHRFAGVAQRPLIRQRQIEEDQEMPPRGRGQARRGHGRGHEFCGGIPTRIGRQ